VEDKLHEMKKLFLAVLLLAILPSVLAISVSIDKQYQPRQAILVKIDGNFLDPIIADNIAFYSGRQLVAMDYNVAKIENSYYLYAILPNTERNYTMIIKNVHYFELGQEKTQNLEYNFSVSGNVSVFTVKPGFIVTDKSFPLTLESNTEKITVDIKYSTFTSSVELMPGIPRTITIPLVYSETVQNLELKSGQTTYSLPVKSLTYARKPKEIVFSQPLYNLSIIRGSPYLLKLYLTNKGSESLKDITISSGKNLNLAPAQIPTLEPNAIAEINVSLAPLESFNDEIEADTSGASASTEILINVITFSIQNYTQEEIMTSACNEIGGLICNDNQVCLGTSKTTIEGTDACCMGKCKTRVSFWTILVVILVIAALGAIAYYFLKLRGKKQQTNVFKQVEQKYAEKFHEVSRSLTKT
jgi:hypothetical protein